MFVYLSVLEVASRGNIMVHIIMSKKGGAVFHLLGICTQILMSL